MSSAYIVPLILLAVVLFLTLPGLPYMSNLGWGYYPALTLGLLMVLVVLMVFRAPSRRLH